MFSEWDSLIYPEWRLSRYRVNSCVFESRGISQPPFDGGFQCRRTMGYSSWTHPFKCFWWGSESLFFVGILQWLEKKMRHLDIPTDLADSKVTLIPNGSEISADAKSQGVFADHLRTLGPRRLRISLQKTAFFQAILSEHEVVGLSLPSGKHTKNYGKPQFLMTINGHFQ